MKSSARGLSSALIDDIERKGIDLALSLEILDAFNNGLYNSVHQVVADDVPTVDGRIVIDLRSSDPDQVLFQCPSRDAKALLEELGMGFPLRADAVARFTRTQLAEIGSRLLPRTAYGVLNGGSATSYIDFKKNKSLDARSFNVLKPDFERFAPSMRDLPKGMTAAYFNPDGSEGASFLELKMRARLLRAASCGNAQKSGLPFLPLFQMTSTLTDPVLASYYATMVDSPYLAGLYRSTGIHPATWMTRIQPLISAYTHSAEGRPKRLFDRAYGTQDSALALPGGHGQCFRVLAPLFKTLRDEGIKFACLGNVDNLGFTPDPVEIAILALSGQPAAFDFAARTPMDIKGGILVSSGGKLTIADIGPALSYESMIELEKKGHTILFNCASGIFNLDYLVPRIEELSQQLPVRFTDQDKDSGRYAQAEQVTWEITGILPSFLAFAVEKKKRFLAAKLLVDTLLTSGFGLDNSDLSEPIRNVACELHEGLSDILQNVYGLELCGGRWTPAEVCR